MAVIFVLSTELRGTDYEMFVGKSTYVKIAIALVVLTCNLYQ